MEQAAMNRLETLKRIQVLLDRLIVDRLLMDESGMIKRLVQTVVSPPIVVYDRRKR
jgi:hypothetical protein